MHTSQGETVVQKPWGCERWLVVFDDLYAVKLIDVRAGEQLSMQRHDRKHETQFYLSGHARIDHGRDVTQMRALDVHGDSAFSGDATVTFEPGTWHRITAVPNVTFLEVQTADAGWTHDIERLADRYGRAGTTAPNAPTSKLNT